jgi:hypothetical protein
MLLDLRHDLGGTIEYEIMGSARQHNELRSREQFGKSTADRHWADRIRIARLILGQVPDPTRSDDQET